jgi:hypothetical protein
MIFVSFRTLDQFASAEQTKDMLFIIQSSAGALATNLVAIGVDQFSLLCGIKFWQKSLICTQQITQVNVCGLLAGRPGYIFKRAHDIYILPYAGLISLS